PTAGWTLACVGVDLSMLLLAAGATAIGGRLAGSKTPSVPWMTAFAGAALIVYASRGLYSVRLRLRLLDDIRRLIVGTALAACVVVTTEIVVDGSVPVSYGVLRLAGFASAYVVAGRVALYWSQQRARSEGESSRPTLIVGAGRIGAVVAKRLLAAPQLGLKPVAFLDKEPLVDTATELGVPVVGASWNLDETIDRFGIQQVIVTFSTAPDEVLLRLVRRCEELGIDVSLVPRLFERMPERYSIDHVGGIALVSPRRANPRAWEFTVKYTFDRIVAAVALLLLSPVLAILSLAVLVSMGRPIFFRQTRIGRDGRSFDMLKFRSMRPNDDRPRELRVVSADVLGPGGVEGSVDRRTRVGSFLRRSSLDELPQLINVLKGDMSLVGPRPERPEYVSEFQQTVYRYSDRHRVKSGITGWAQVHGLRGKTSLADRAEWDNFYIENFSLWLDLKIALKTVGAVLGSFATVE
ncbi:MAG TPA: sugar transferase, partial [Gaiellaceae bacterium]|nr:sugar transferase [Gaiellaceae bacterium]